jgi:hypothetical protein
MRNKMSVISKKVRGELELDPRRFTCSLKGVHGHVCDGRITREHAMYYAGKKIQERWAIIFLCAKGHGVDQFQDHAGQVPKDMRQWVALNQATREDIARFPRAFPSFGFQKDRLNEKYGPYVPPSLPLNATAINY